MADTNLLILAREFKKLRTDVKEVLQMPVGPQGLQGEKGEKGVKGDQGIAGRDGRDGKDGKDGLNGLNGTNGKDGVDGKDGKDGVSVVDAYIDFDGTLVLKLSNGNEINAGEVSQAQAENVFAMLKNGAASLNELLPSQTGNANKYLKTNGTNTSWDTLDGSDIDLSSPPSIGQTTPAAGTFTTLIGGGGSANYFQTQGAAATKAVEAKALGTDTNIAFVIDSKGTGAIDLAAGSSGVNISNGGTVTSITRTNASSGYTSFPSVVISAPTTAGGVQATAVVGTMGNTGASVASGGTGYAVNDVLTVIGGTPYSVAATLTVTSVSAGVITGVTPTNFGQYTVLPPTPASVTGGTGSGATLNLTWGIGSNPSFTITNAGSGYVEQPTVSFSGGGGSGAAAYASVGASVTVKGLAGTVNFATSGGTNFAVLDSSLNTPAAFPYATGGSGSGGMGITGTATNAGFTFTSKGTSAVDFYTNSYGSLGLKVTHTASAVNYVQVTGAATGSAPVISAQGSDTNVSITLASKGTGNAALQASSTGTASLLTDGGLTSIRGIPRATNGDTWLEVQRAVGSVILSAASGVTNGDLALTPKGTGVVQFGTYTATILTPTGYITIKDSGGTTRRVLIG